MAQNSETTNNKLLTFTIQAGPFSSGRGKFKSVFPTATFLVVSVEYHEYITQMKISPHAIVNVQKLIKTSFFLHYTVNEYTLICFRFCFLIFTALYGCNEISISVVFCRILSGKPINRGVELLLWLMSRCLLSRREVVQGPGQILLKAPPHINNTLRDHKNFRAFLALGGGALIWGPGSKCPLPLLSELCSTGEDLCLKSQTFESFSGIVLINTDKWNNSSLYWRTNIYLHWTTTHGIILSTDC
jgi:hypothetical protein